MEELFLGLFLTFQKLDVVDQQHIHVAIPAPEVGSPVLADRVDEVVGQFLSGDVANPNPVEVVAYVVAERVQQVGLAETGVPVDCQWVVRLAWVFGDGDRGRMREAVRAADDEGLEGILWVQPRIVVTAGPESLDISVNVAITVRRLGLGHFRPHWRGMRPAISAEAMLPVLVLIPEVFAPKGLLA